MFSRNPGLLSSGWHREAPYWKEVVKKPDKEKAREAEPANESADEHAKPKKKAASSMKIEPVAKQAPEGKHELRRWAVGTHQENTGSFVRIFVNPKQKKLVTLRSADGKEFNISHRSLTPDDLAYLESIQAVGH